MRQCAYRIADHDPAVIENLLELRGGLGGLVRGQIGFTTHIDWIKRPEEPIKAAVRRAQVIWKAHVRPSRSGWPQAHSRKSLPTVPARFHPEPPCPAGPHAEPVPPHHVTPPGLLQAARIRRHKKPGGLKSSLPLRIFPGPEPLPVAFPPCRFLKRRCRSAGPKSRGFPACARRLAGGCSWLLPGGRGIDSSWQEAHNRWQNLERGRLLSWLLPLPDRTFRRSGKSPPGSRGTPSHEDNFAPTTHRSVSPFPGFQ